MHRSERGVVLLITMVVLILVTILGVSSVRTGITQDRMTNHQLDRNVTFQAAEAALREGEALAREQARLNNPDFPAAVNAPLGSLNGTFIDSNSAVCNSSPCVDGLCSQPDWVCPPRWETPPGTSTPQWRPATTVGGLAGPAGSQQFMVEYLGTNLPCDPTDPNALDLCKRYRVTAWSSAGDDRSLVILQSIYATQ